MNFNKHEEKVIQETVEQAVTQVFELSELELAVVGGGCGEVIFG